MLIWGGINRMAKIVFISQGHGGADGGSTGADGKSEKRRIRNLSPLIEERLKTKGYKVVMRDEKNSSGNWAFSSASGDLKFSLHFNAFNEKATGVECYYKKSSMKKYANSMSKKVAKAIGITDRGGKYTSSLRMMNIGFDLLLEVCFHDNKKDLDKYKDNMKAVADAIAEVIDDALGGSKSNSGSSSNNNEKEKLEVDGSWGKDCTRKSQKVLGTSVDGIVSNQPVSNKKYLPNAFIGSWEFKSSGYSAGSSLIRAIQKLIGATTDGWFGQNSVKKTQKFLKKKGFYTGEIDGSMGSKTVKAWQRYINSRL